jgi:hypothetical protein
MMELYICCLHKLRSSFTFICVITNVFVGGSRGEVIVVVVVEQGGHDNLPHHHVIIILPPSTTPVFLCFFVLLDSVFFSHMFLHEIPTALHFTHKRSMGDRTNRYIVGH